MTSLTISEIGTPTELKSSATERTRDRIPLSDKNRMSLLTWTAVPAATQPVLFDMMDTIQSAAVVASLGMSTWKTRRFLNTMILFL